MPLKTAWRRCKLRRQVSPPTRGESWGGYRTVVADPPWPILGPGGGRSRVKPAYPLMQLEQIKLLGVADAVASDAHLYLWTTQQFVCAARQVAEAWGFAPAVLHVWCKPGLGAGGRFRPNTEFFWFCQRGYDRLPVTRRDVGTWHSWKRGPHSAKPDEFFALVESVSPGPYLELFSRRERGGWDSWGDESANSSGLKLGPGMPLLEPGRGRS